jgi:hypothetical protein
MDMKAICGALLFLLILWLTAAYGQESQENSAEVSPTSSSSSSSSVRKRIFKKNYFWKSAILFFK